MKRLLALLALFWTAPAVAEPVDLELALAVDTSASVDSTEFALQVRGMAEAFRHPAVLRAIQGLGPDGMAVAVILWSDTRHQRLVVDWQKITDQASAEIFARQIEKITRGDTLGSTALGTAINYSAWSALNNAFEGRRKTIDVSGDGPSNSGEKPALSRDRAVTLGFTINGLVVENEEPFLQRYFERNVLGGTGAFAVAATSYEAYAQAFLLKLIREIPGAPVAMNPDPAGETSLAKAP